jgi:hypothetical protein
VPELHVTNGESVADTLRQTRLGGAVLPWQDALHEGPVPAVPRQELLQRRADFLAGCGLGSPQALLSSLERRDTQLLDAPRLVLWFEHDLYDQLQLLDVLALADSAGVAPELIVIGSFPGKPSFRGLGELTAGELETLWPSRRAADSNVLATATAAWAAFREPEPYGLAEWAGSDTPELPFLCAALRRLLEELPAVSSGLSGTERRALEAIAAGADTPAAAFVAAQELEEAPFLGDTWFFRALSALGQGDSRLVESGEGLRLRLTAAGERVLRGDADRVELLGVDRWIGGTHVTSDTPWRWDASARRLV